MASLHVSRENISLRQVALDHLRNAILSGRLAPGQKLVERELCEQLGVSRPLLREVLQALQSESLVTNIPHRGPFVSEITVEEAREIYAVREALEGLAGEGFARNASDAQVRQLREALNYLGTQEPGSDLVAAKNRFYAILLEGCGNRIIGQLLTQLNNRVTLLRRLSMRQSGRLPTSLAELDEIVSAIEARDAKRTREACMVHVAKAAEVIATYFDSA